MFSRWLVMMLFATYLGMPVRGTAQTAQVTFYSDASRVKMLAIHSDQAAFYGFLYDGPTRLAALSRGRRATFVLPAGDHSFSASFSKHPAKNSQLVLNLTAGASYYVAVESHVVTVYYPVFFQLQRGILNQVDCQAAQIELAGLKPLEAKHVSKEMHQSLAPEPPTTTCAP